jgi:hypothetical protein
MLVHPAKDDAVQSVEFLERDGRRRIPRAHPDDRRLDLGRRPKVAFADFHDVFDSGKELDVGRQSAPQFRAGGRAETEREFALKHEDRGADDGPVGEELED